MFSGDYMNKEISELLEGVFIDNKITSKEINLLIFQAEELSVDKTELLKCVKEKYVDIIVNNGGISRGVKSTIRLLSKTFGITYNKLLLEFEAGVDKYIKAEKKKGKDFVTQFKREYKDLSKKEEEASDEYIASMPSYRTQRIRQRLAGFGLVKEKINEKEKKKYLKAASDVEHFIDSVNPQSPGEISELLVYLYSQSDNLNVNFTNLIERILLQAKAEYPNNIVLKDVTFGVQYKMYYNKIKTIFSIIGIILLLMVMLAVAAVLDQYIQNIF